MCPHITGSLSPGHLQLQHLQVEHKRFLKENQPPWQGGNLKTQRKPQHEQPPFSSSAADICVLTTAWEGAHKANSINEVQVSVSLVSSDPPLHLYNE